MKLVILMTFSAAAMAQTGLVPAGVAGGASGGIFGTPVTGSPYSAEETSERVQTLADGTRITQSQGSVKYYRDSLGRTRTERTLPGPPGVVAGFTPPTIVEIFDPIAGVHYTLDENSRTAHKMSVRILPPPPPPPATSSAPAPRALMARISPGPIPTRGPANNDAQQPQVSRESLGTQMIEGVMAEGTRTTMTYPIGSIGNDRPITETSEIWRSPELRITVLTKNSSPMSGDLTTKITNISRSEPDPSLFQAPADYQIVDDQAQEQRR